jgi:hypothetical protein
MQVVAREEAVTRDMVAHVVEEQSDAAPVDGAADGTPLTDEFPSEADMPTATDSRAEASPNPLDGFDSEGQVG